MNKLKNNISFFEEENFGKQEDVKYFYSYEISHYSMLFILFNCTMLFFKSKMYTVNIKSFCSVFKTKTTDAFLVEKCISGPFSFGDKLFLKRWG